MLNLGIIYKDDKIVNHRSLLKVSLNPIFRYFGFCIGTICTDNELKGLKILKCEKRKIKWQKYDVQHKTIIKKRIII